jgi:hypothetical protein
MAAVHAVARAAAANTGPQLGEQLMRSELCVVLACYCREYLPRTRAKPGQGPRLVVPCHANTFTEWRSA